ncbi:MAG: TRAP transporter small permease [Bradyrhizobiaceae bacterium]|nr:TRAP transporter small permease [Bradyrhizobiaceae bacterium]
MLDTFLIRPVRRMAEISAMIAAVILMACAVATAVDVVLRNYFLGGITGMVELTQLAVIWAAFLTIPLGFAHESHVYVDLITGAMKPRLRLHLRNFAMLAGAVVMALYAWWGARQALVQIYSGERTLTLGVPISYYWAPIIYGTTFSVVCVLTRYLQLLTGCETSESPELSHEL